MTRRKPKPRGHHFIPQYLLAGFDSRGRAPGSNQHHTWVFRNGIDPHEANIRDVGKKRDFHGSAELEEAFSAEESAQAQLVQRLRGEPAVCCEPNAIARLVSRLLVRTNNIRDSFSSGARTVFESIAELLREDAYENRLRRLAATEISQKLRSKYSREIRLLSRDKRGILEATLRRLCKTADLPEYKSGAEQALKTFDVDGTAKDAHNKALQQSNRSTPLVQRLEALCWSCMNFEESRLVLGDSVVIAWMEDTFTHPLETPADLNFAVPLSTHVMLFGLLPGAQILAPEVLNRDAAELSLQFFVSSQNGPLEKSYAELIGTKALRVSKDDLKRNLLRDE